MSETITGMGSNESVVSVPRTSRPARIDGRRLRSERTRQLIIERNIDGDRPTRIRSQVETRAGTCERGIALWRVLIASAAEDDDLKDRVRISRERTIERLEIMYRPELSTLSDQERKYMLIALEAITEIESWARMREQHGLSVDQACAVWIRAIDRMLPPTPRAA